MTRSNTMPDFSWSVNKFEVNDVLSHMGAKRIDKCLSSMFPLEQDMQGKRPAMSSPMRKSMDHACRGVVRRMTLDPKSITDDK